MIKHEQIWRGIDRLADVSGYSASGLAKKAGLDPTSFNRSKRLSPDGKPRWPSTESIAKILSVTGSTMSDFIALVGEEDAGAPRDHGQGRIPMIGFAQAGQNGYFDEDGYPAGSGWDEIEYPIPGTRVQDRGRIFALQVQGHSMEPLYRKGDLLVVSSGAHIKRGDRVIVKTRKGEVMAKELLRQSTHKLTLKSLNPSFEDRVLPMDQIAWIARICWVSQ